MVEREIGNMITVDEKGFYIAKNNKGDILKLNDKALRKYFEMGIKILIDSNPVATYQDVKNLMFVRENEQKIAQSATEFFADF